jgi:hypothetical protein
MKNTHSPLKLPDMAFVRQQLFCSGIDDVAETVRTSLHKIPDHCQTEKGKTVAVAVGSRNIDNIDIVLDQCLRFLEQRGFKPFIVPAMGSHGGATAAGQKEVLAKFQITETTMKVPILADMGTESIATHSSGMKIHVSKAALSADHVVIVNRIKPHTKFKADIESGLCKMMTIGLGKANGASEFHRYAVSQSFGIIEDAVKILLNKLNVLFGIGLLEDGHGKIARVEVVFPDDLINREKVLLKKAVDMMGSIPFDGIDILIVDQIGKDISGIGMDSNITGRHRDIVGDVNMSPHVKRIFVRDLSPGSDGNGNGIGLADVTTRRLVERLDIDKTYMNAITAISPEKAAIPIHFDTDQQCLDACVKTTGVAAPDDLRVVRIKNTASLEYLQVSKTLEKEILSNRNLNLITPWNKIGFDEFNNLPEFNPELKYDE